MSQRVRLWLALGVVYVVWGSTYLAIRILVESAPPLLSSGARFLVAGLVLATGVAIVRGPGALRTTPRQLGSCTAIGALLLLGGTGLVVLAERQVASGVAALMIATVPLVVVLIRLIAGDRPRRATVVSAYIGFAGIAVLVGFGDSGPIAGMLLLVISPVSWALGSWLSPRLPQPANPLVGTAWQMVAGGLLMTAAGSAAGEWQRYPLSQVTGRSWAAWAYLLVAGSLIAFTAYVWLLHHAPLSIVATYAYVNPAVAVVLAAVVLNERLTPAIALGAMAIVLSVAIVVSAESSSRRVIRVRRPRSRGEEPCADDTTGTHRCLSCTASCALAAAVPSGAGPR